MSIDNTISYVLSCLRLSSENSYPWSLTPNEAGLLVAEVERLREQRRIDNQEADRVYDFARNKGAALERAVVVAWLRQQGGRGAWTLTDNIERGDHRREEEVCT